MKTNKPTISRGVRIPQDLYDEAKAKNIDLSKFLTTRLERLLKKGSRCPLCNQFIKGKHHE